MRRKAIVLGLVSTLFLQGCAGAVLYDATRKNAVTSVSMVMAQERPGANVDAATACVINAMTLTETMQIGTYDNYKRVPQNVRKMILDYAARPEAEACLKTVPAA